MPGDHQDPELVGQSGALHQRIKGMGQNNPGCAHAWSSAEHQLGIASCPVSSTAVPLTPAKAYFTWGKLARFSSMEAWKAPNRDSPPKADTCRGGGRGRLEHGLSGTDLNGAAG